MTDDLKLLREYAATDSEDAFSTLVERHVDFVYSVALREVGKPDVAEEVVQATFIILARKANRIGAGTILSGWLFKTARFAARNAKRQAFRRQRREEEAAEMSTSKPRGDSTWREISALLNDALASLGDEDRNVVTLRFFEGKSHDEIGRATGVSEVSARKRLSRAMDRLRSFLARRGVAVSTGALLTVLPANAVQAAPLDLASSVTAAALTQGAGTAVSMTALVKGTLKMMAWTKAKAAAVAGVALVFVAGTATVLVTSETRETGKRSLAGGGSLELKEYHFTDRLTYQHQAAGSWWERSLRAILPVGASRAIGIGGGSSGSITTASAEGTNLFLVTVETGGNGGTVGRVQVFTEEGDRSDGIFAAGMLGIGNERVDIWNVTAFPRRARTLGLRFYSASKEGWVNIAEFKVPNPLREDFPEWTAQALPVTMRDGDLSVTMADFETGISGEFEDARMSSFWKTLPMTRGTFDVRQQGVDIAPWTVRKLTVSDGTGNRWSPHNLDVDIEAEPAGRMTVSMLGELWPSEPAWKWRLELTRTNGFASHELLKVSAVSVPAAGTSVAIGRTHEVNGVAVSIDVIGGRGAELPSPFRWAEVEGDVNLGVIAQGRERQMRLSLLAVVDDRGRMVPVNGRNARKGNNLVFGLDPAKDARWMEFTFAMHQSRFAEFVAKPRQGGHASR